MAALRTDLVFSYWIFFWYLLYALKLTKYSPKFALLFGIIDNIILLVLMIAFGSSKRTIFYFILINTLIKGLPYYTLIKEPIKLSDIYFTGLLLLVFVIWLHINKQSLIGNIKTDLSKHFYFTELNVNTAFQICNFCKIGFGIVELDSLFQKYE